ncbi:MAG: SDR family NAD(P)-dependent oxidoreductase [Dysgonomonas sp.]
MVLHNKKIILTGASSGIGKEILNILAGYAGIRIIAVARHTEEIKQSDHIYPLSADASTQEGVDKIFSYAQNIFGNTDIFIANAGFAYIEKLNKPDWNHIENIFQLNVFSPIYTLEKLIAEDGEEHKIFVSTISGAGLVPLPAYSLYCATKAALHHFIETYRYEQQKNIQITSVYPVATHTDFFDKAAGCKEAPMPWPSQDSRKVASKIVRGIEGGKKRIYPSFIFRLFYPIGRAFPFLLKLYSKREKTKVKRWLD